jgi:hypothetical protein
MTGAGQHNSEGLGKTRRRAMSAYRWNDRFQWLTSLFKTPAEVGFATASAAVVGTVTGMTLLDAVETRANRDLKPIVEERARTTDNSTMIEIVGYDKAGRRGVFEVVVLNKDFMWVHASADELERQGTKIPAAQVADIVLDQDARISLAEAREIIAVGTASQEGQAAAEHERARKRAERTAEIAGGPTPDWVPVYTLNLGQYREPCASCETTGTSWQRPFIFISVKDLQDGTVMSEALADALTGKDNLPSPTSYSAFELTKIRG